jgi:hypothetical protein
VSFVDYYDDSSSRETTFDGPADGLLLDPVNINPFVFPEDGPPTHSERDCPSLDPQEDVAEPADVSEPVEFVRPVAAVHLKTIRPGIEATPNFSLQSRSQQDGSGEKEGDGDRSLSAGARLRGASHPSLVSFARQSSFFPDPRSRALPSDLQDMIPRFQLDDYARQFFREHRTNKSFSRKKVSVDAITRFQTLNEHEHVDKQIFEILELAARARE